MRKLIVTLVCGAFLVCGLSVRAQDSGEKTTVEGELLDTHCYAKSGATGEGHGQKCGAACARSGIPVAVLVDGKALTLSTNPAPLAEAVGKTVRVSGTRTDSGIFVPDKVEVKEGEGWKELKMKDAHRKG